MRYLRVTLRTLCLLLVLRLCALKALLGLLAALAAAALIDAWCQRRIAALSFEPPLPSVNFWLVQVAAICAAPIVLHKAGLTGGRRITGYPGSEQMAPGLVYTGERTETDRGVVTGKGPGAAFEFAFALAAALGSTAEEIRNVKQQMLVL